MALDPSIALGVKPLEVPNPLNQFAQMTQLQGLQQANQLNELKMQEARAAGEERNALRQLNPANADYENQLFKVNPQLGIQYRKERTAAEAQAATAANQKVTAAAEKQKMLGQAWRDISGRPSDANILAHLEDIQSSPLFSEQEKASTEKRTQALLAMPLAERKSFLERMGSTGSDYASRANNAATVAATLRGQNMVDARAKENQAISAAIPTVTQIVDPTNPNQMITVDARRYQGGGANSAGVIGVSGKEPTAALRINKAEEGKTQLADDLDNLRASFQTLDQLRAIPSTERGGLSNVSSAIASSRVGQLTGQAFATEAQVERDVINSARQRLVNSIKNATGMSAQQLNSNVELQTMLKSISDPGQSYQSAIRIIDDIEQAYVKGNGKMPKRPKPNAGGGDVDTSNPLLN